MAEGISSEHEDITHVFADFFPRRATGDFFWQGIPEEFMHKVISDVEELLGGLNPEELAQKVGPPYRGESVESISSDSAVVTVRLENVSMAMDKRISERIVAVNANIHIGHSSSARQILYGLTEQFDYRQHGGRPEQLAVHSLRRGNGPGMKGLELLTALLPKNTTIHAVRDDCLQYGMPPPVLRYQL